MLDFAIYLGLLAYAIVALLAVSYWTLRGWNIVLFPK